MSRGLQIALVGAILLLAVGVVGIGAYVFLSPGALAQAGSQSAVEAPAKQEAPVEVVFFQTKNFVTDLADTDRMRYVDLTIALGLAGQAAADAAQKQEPLIRDIVLTEMRKKRAADLTSAAGKELLAESLKTALTEVLQGSLQRVFITDLVVQ